MHAGKNYVQLRVVRRLDVDRSSFAAQVGFYPQKHLNAVFFLGFVALAFHLIQVFSPHSESGVRKAVIGYRYPFESLFRRARGVIENTSLTVTVLRVSVQIKVDFQLFFIVFQKCG